MLDRPSLVPRLGDVRVPTVFLAGAEDELLPLDEARAQAAAIPGSQFVVVTRSSHQGALEAPAEVLSVVRGALDRWLAVPQVAP